MSAMGFMADEAAGVQLVDSLPIDRVETAPAA
jgi:hypothetical protein